MTIGINSANTQKVVTKPLNSTTSNDSTNSAFLDSSQNADNDKINFDYLSKRNKIASDYKAKTGKFPYESNGTNEQDQSYNYVNENKGGKSPISKVYSLTTEATYINREDGTMKKASQTIACGQQITKGNNVSIGNTFIAYLTNNNDQTTAKIGNTDAKGLAHNFFTSTDNIQAGNAPGITSVKTASGQKIVSKNQDGSGQTRLIGDINTKVTVGDKKLNDEELRIAKYAYVLDAQALSASDKLNKTDSESQKRISSASTVDIDDDDPYDKFMKKVGALDGKEGVTEAELEEGIKQISEQTKDGGLFFSKDKLNTFLYGTKKASP